MALAGAVFHVNNGRLTRFLDDVWKGDISLKLAYPMLYDLSENKIGVVSDFFVNGCWQLAFRRALTPQDVPM